MKKISKIGLTTIAAGISVVAPIATVVSCGKGSQKNDHVVLIKAGWAKNGPQTKAFQKVVERYNATNPEYKVKFQNIEGGYGKIAGLEIKDIKLNHMDPVSDLFIDYPDAVGQLAAQGAQLDLSKLGENSIKREDFESQFMGVNDNIGGIKHHTNGKSTYVAPIAASTEMLSGDMPVLHYMLQKLAKNGVNVEGMDSNGAIKANHNVSSTSLLGQVLEYKAAKGSTDLDEVKKIWGDISDTSKLNGYKVNVSTFTDYTKISEFSAIVEKAFGHNAGDDAYVMGIDAPTNSVYQAIFGLNDYDINKFFTQKDEFKNFIKSGKNADKVKAGLEIFHDAVQNGGIKLLGGGAYSSVDLVNHRVALSWGSTAGFSHNYVGSNTHFTMINGKKVELGSYSKQIIKKFTNSNGKVETATGDILGFTADHHHNKVYKNTTKTTLGKYDIKLSQEATNLLMSNTQGDTIGWLSSAKALKENADIKKAYSIKLHGHSYQYFALTAASVKTSGENAGKTLQQNEVAFADAPRTVKDGNKTTTMIQGPSLIGIKHGGKKDIETGKFIKWLFTTKDTIKYQDRELTPVEYFDLKAQYITPIAGAFKDAKSSWKKGNAIAYKAFHDLTQDKANHFGFQAPVNRLSSTLRKNVFDQVLKSSWSDVMHSRPNRTLTTENIYGEIVKLYKSYSI